VKQVEIAIQHGGGDTTRISRSGGKRSGLFNARGRDAKLSPNLMPRYRRASCDAARIRTSHVAEVLAQLIAEYRITR
jgi:hypothetical protein